MTIHDWGWLFFLGESHSGKQLAIAYDPSCFIVISSMNSYQEPWKKNYCLYIMTLFLLALLTESLLHSVFGTRWNCSINTCFAQHMCTCLGVYPLTLGLPSNKLTVCYVKLPFGSRIYPSTIVIFHCFLYVDQRVLPIEYLTINH